MKLNKNFVNELFKLSLRKKAILELCITHLKYHYLPDQWYKEIFKQQWEYYMATEKLITIGLLSTEIETKPKALKVLNEIKIADTLDEEACITQLEEFIKRKFFTEFYDEIGEKYEKGNREEAYDQVMEFTEQMQNFQLKDTSTYTKIIGGFNDRYETRVSKEQVSKKKVPTGIPEMDELMFGGVDRQDIALVMAESGVGKSYFLRWIGLSAARRGFRVVHIQVEGSKQECVDSYDAGIAGNSISNIEYGNLSSKELQEVKKAIANIEQGQGEIFVKAFEQFDNGSMRDVHTYCQEITDKFGQIDLLVLDYIDETDAGDGKRYSTSNDGERKRRESTAKKFKNTCIEFDCAGWTATQSNTRPPEEKNDPEFVLTRYHVSEFKGLIKPFSYFITLNQTSDEKEQGVMRIYRDKWRKYSNSTSRVIPLCTTYGSGRFYNHERTIAKFG